MSNSIKSVFMIFMSKRVKGQKCILFSWFLAGCFQNMAVTHKQTPIITFNQHVFFLIKYHPTDQSEQQNQPLMTSPKQPSSQGIIIQYEYDQVLWMTLIYEGKTDKLSLLTFTPAWYAQVKELFQSMS